MNVAESPVFVIPKHERIAKTVIIYSKVHSWVLLTVLTNIINGLLIQSKEFIIYAKSMAFSFLLFVSHRAEQQSLFWNQWFNVMQKFVHIQIKNTCSIISWFESIQIIMLIVQRRCLTDLCRFAWNENNHLFDARERDSIAIRCECLRTVCYEIMWNCRTNACSICTYTLEFDATNQISYQRMIVFLIDQ